MIVWTDKRDRRVALKLKDWPGAIEAVSLIPTDSKTYCFPIQRSIATNPKERAQLSMAFTRLCRAVGIQGHSFHGLRSTFASEASERGRWFSNETDSTAETPWAAPFRAVSRERDRPWHG